MITCEMMRAKLEAYDFDKEIKIILENGTQLLFQLQKNQWIEGLRSDRTPIGQYASKPYAMKKNKQNPKAGFGFIDLIDTEETIDSLKVDISGEFMNYELQKDDHDLVVRYGEDILGLNIDSRKIFIENYLRDKILISFNEKTGAI